MMTDQEALEKYEAMQKEFGDKLCDPETEPLQFAYQVKLFDRFHWNKSDDENKDKK